jgi:predicted HAD superfamily Cof-like phosphohydrolase
MTKDELLEDLGRLEDSARKFVDDVIGRDEQFGDEHEKQVREALVSAYDLGANHRFDQSVDQQVAEFHKLMEIPDRTTPGLPDADTIRLRMRLVLEEAFELCEACFDYAGRDDIRSYKQRVLALIWRANLDPRLPDIADALGDIDYVVAGTRLQLGIQGKPIADAIHEANMNKAPGGVVKKDDFGKVQKPADWKPADIEGKLRLQGWKP